MITHPGVATSSITAVFGTYDNLGGNQDDYTYASVCIADFRVVISGVFSTATPDIDIQSKEASHA